MPYQFIPVSQLVVNRDNDRHGPMASEASAIAWLLANRAQHMRKLATDIVEQEQIFEPPLVRSEDQGFVVYDGNRRVTCLKLLLNPGLASTPEWQGFFQELSKQAGDSLPSVLECRVEEDIELIDEIVFRRHTGSQGGIGQSSWGVDAKINFTERTGKNRKVNVARLLMECLKKSGHVSSVWDVKISTLNRLLSGESQRNQIGLKLSKNELFFTHEPDAVMKAVKKIVEDIQAGNLILPQVWKADSKNAYLISLAADSVLPTAKFVLGNPVLVDDWLLGETSPGSDQSGDVEDTDAAQDDEEEGVDHSGGDDGDSDGSDETDLGTAIHDRVRFIPEEVPYGLSALPELVRIRAIWDELQFKLDVHIHTNAVSVLSRALFELSVNYYLNTVGLGGQVSAGWSDRFKEASKHMLSQELIDQDYFDILRAMHKKEDLLSVNSMNKYVHSSDLSPSPKHLCSIWDTVQKFIVICLKAK